jgi:Phosphoesterase family
VPPGSAESAFRVTDSHADPAAFSVVELASMVSPYARPDYVTSTVYDHTSILKLVQQKWNLPSLTRRDGAAASPLEALDLEGEPAFLTRRSCPSPAWHGARGSGHSGKHQRPAAQALHTRDRA